MQDDQLFAGSTADNISFSPNPRTYRPETIRSADRVIVLEQGKVMKNLQVLADDSDLPPSLAALFGD